MTKVEVFTEQLDQCYNILTQQMVIINTMKEVLNNVAPCYHYHFYLEDEDETYDARFDVYTSEELDGTYDNLVAFMNNKVFNCYGTADSMTKPLINIYGSNNAIHIGGDSGAIGITSSIHITMKKETI